jgi:Holliday junction resolvasome RuvABC DNA-binding subunit
MEECPDMPKKKYIVDLTAEERTLFEQLLRLGKTGARILLKAASGLSDAEMAAALDVATVV